MIALKKFYQKFVKDHKGNAEKAITNKPPLKPSIHFSNRVQTVCLELCPCLFCQSPTSFY